MNWVVRFGHGGKDIYCSSLTQARNILKMYKINVTMECWIDYAGDDEAMIF